MAKRSLFCANQQKKKKNAKNSKNRDFGTCEQAITSTVCYLDVSSSDLTIFS